MKGILKRTVNYGKFQIGDLVKEGELQDFQYWKGCNSIRESRGHLYLALCGARHRAGMKVFSEYVFEVKNTDENKAYLIKNLDDLRWNGYTGAGNTVEILPYWEEPKLEFVWNGKNWV